jgi:hypothetical protein
VLRGEAVGEVRDEDLLRDKNSQPIEILDVFGCELPVQKYHVGVSASFECLDEHAMA